MNITYRQRTDRPDKEGRCVLFMDITWGGERLLQSTGVKCKPEHFQESKRQKVSTRDLNATALNSQLASIEKVINTTFTLAAGKEEAVTPYMLKKAIQELPQAARRKSVVAPLGPMSLTQLYDIWKLEHPGQSKDAARRYTQVLKHLNLFHENLALEHITKPVFYDYLAYLQRHNLSDGTISNHIKFLRACYMLSEKQIPGWLKFNAKYGRAVALRRDEFGAIWQLSDLPPYLLREKERLLFQTLLLLRDSDLRKIKPHHVTYEELPGCGLVPVLRFYQTKTNEAVAVPLPAPAAHIWACWDGKVPIVAQQNRNIYMKELAQLAGLDRVHVRVRFKMGKPQEEPLPLWQVITTHTPRHTGADLVLWGSDGDTNLKELALGHTVGMSAYGYDTLERYAPLLLKAWRKVLAEIKPANTTGDTLRTFTNVCAPPPTGFLVAPVAFRS